jgi:hypothetical protein
MVKAKPFVKRAWEGDDTMLVVKEDDTMPMVKENDVVPVVNQDEALVRDDWTVGIMSKAFLKIRHVLQNTGMGTLNLPLEEMLSSYVFIFHQLADVLEELPAYLNKNYTDSAKYILAYYQSWIDGFDTSVAMHGINH